jgi:hypothetical protein
MSFKRRQVGAFSLPHIPSGAWKSEALPLGLITLILAVFMPLFGVVACVLIVVELLISQQQRYHT